MWTLGRDFPVLCLLTGTGPGSGSRLGLHWLDWYSVAGMVVDSLANT